MQKILVRIIADNTFVLAHYKEICAKIIEYFLPEEWAIFM